MYYVYVVLSSTSGKFYIGQTDSLEKRLDQHNGQGLGKRPYTKLNGKDWKLVYKEEFRDRSLAVKREKQLKSYKGREFIKNEILGL